MTRLIVTRLIVLAFATIIFGTPATSYATLGCKKHFSKRFLSNYEQGQPRNQELIQVMALLKRFDTETKVLNKVVKARESGSDSPEFTVAYGFEQKLKRLAERFADRVATGKIKVSETIVEQALEIYFKAPKTSQAVKAHHYHTRIWWPIEMIFRAILKTSQGPYLHERLFYLAQKGDFDMKVDVAWVLNKSSRFYIGTIQWIRNNILDPILSSPWWMLEYENGYPRPARSEAIELKKKLRNLPRVKTDHEFFE